MLKIENSLRTQEAASDIDISCAADHLPWAAGRRRGCRPVDRSIDYLRSGKASRMLANRSTVRLISIDRVVESTRSLAQREGVADAQQDLGVLAALGARPVELRVSIACGVRNFQV